MEREQSILRQAGLLLRGLLVPEESELDAEEMVQVNVAESVDKGTFNEQFLVTFHRLDDIKPFADLLRSTEETGHKVQNVPDFDFEFHWKGGETERYHCWLGQRDQSSFIRRIGSGESCSSVPDHVTNRLIDVLHLDS